jgi:WD40 repeat-containing protein SMU1
MNLPMNGSVVLCFAWSKDSSMLVSGRIDGSVAVCNVLAQPFVIRHIGWHDSEVRAVVLNSSGTQIFSGGSDCCIKIWGACEGGKAVLLHTLHRHTGSVECISLSADELRIVSGSNDGSVIMWDTESGAPLAMCQRGERGVESVDWLSEGSFVSCNENQVWVWEVCGEVILV